MIRLSLLISALLSVAIRVAEAQEAAPREFFKHDYASAPGAKGGEAERAQRPQQATGRVPAGSAVMPQQDQNASARKIAVTLFVNSLDQAHLDQVIATVHRLVDQRLAYVSLVAHLGDYRNISGREEEWMRKRGIMLLPVSSLTSPVQVSQSPVWLVQTEKGGYVVEGVVGLDRMLNAFGEFDPKAVPQSDSVGELSEF